MEKKKIKKIIKGVALLSVGAVIGFLLREKKSDITNLISKTICDSNSKKEKPNVIGFTK